MRASHRLQRRVRHLHLHQQARQRGAVPHRLVLDMPALLLRLPPGLGLGETALRVELVRRPLRRLLPLPRPAPLSALLLLPHAEQPPPARLVLLLLGEARGGSLVVLLPLPAQRGGVPLLRGQGHGHPAEAGETWRSKFLASNGGRLASNGRRAGLGGKPFPTQRELISIIRCMATSDLL